jgi:hypothetical protein
MCVGRFGDLTGAEKHLLVTMADKCDPEMDNAWSLSAAPSGAVLLGVTQGTENVDGVSSAVVTYESLARKGYLAIDPLHGRSIQVRIEQQGLDYAAYARKPKVARRLQDFGHDMVTEGTLLGKLGWAALGALLALLASSALGGAS